MAPTHFNVIQHASEQFKRVSKCRFQQCWTGRLPISTPSESEGSQETTRIFTFFTIIQGIGSFRYSRTRVQEYQKDPITSAVFTLILCSFQFYQVRFKSDIDSLPSQCSCNRKAHTVICYFATGVAGAERGRREGGSTISPCPSYLLMKPLKFLLPLSSKKGIVWR